jgi:hypothetical protein
MFPGKKIQGELLVSPVIYLWLFLPWHFNFKCEIKGIFIVTMDKIVTIATI